MIIQAQAGDRQALEELITHHWQSVYKIIVYKIGNGDDAQELAQETFIKAMKSLDRYEPRSAFINYLGRIALNLVTDYWRKNSRIPPTIELADYAQPLADIAVGPEKAALDAESGRELVRLMKQLPDEQRRAVELRVIAGLSIKDAAIIMNKTEGALKMLQQRALNNLRQLCVENGIGQ